MSPAGWAVATAVGLAAAPQAKPRAADRAAATDRPCAVAERLAAAPS